MNRQSKGLGEKLVGAMVPARNTDFNALVDTYSRQQHIREATDGELIEMARSGRGLERIKAIQLLGALRVSSAEQTLAGVLPKQITLLLKKHGDHQVGLLVVTLYTALLLINRTTWAALVKEEASRLQESWVGSALMSVLAEVEH